MDKRVSTGLKVWLWIIIVLNVLGAFVNLLGLLLAPLASIIGLVVEALIIVGSILIIFKAKKLGFILICAASVINLVNSLVAALSAGSTTIIGVFIGAALIPVVTFLMMKKDWNMFD